MDVKNSCLLHFGRSLSCNQSSLNCNSPVSTTLATLITLWWVFFNLSISLGRCSAQSWKSSPAEGWPMLSRVERFMSNDAPVLQVILLLIHTRALRSFPVELMTTQFSPFLDLKHFLCPHAWPTPPVLPIISRTSYCPLRKKKNPYGKQSCMKDRAWTQCNQQNTYPCVEIYTSYLPASQRFTCICSLQL